MMKKNIVYILLLVMLTAVIPFTALLVRSDKNITKPVTTTVQTPSEKTTLKSAQQNNNAFRIYDNAFQKTITVSDFDFCIGAIATQTDIDVPYEALKAEIVAVHTYYAYLRNESRKNNKDFDFECNSKTWKVYVSESQLKEKLRDTFDEYYQTFKNAVEEVGDTFIYYNNALCKASYFEISAGNTFSYNEIYEEDIPYLYSVPSPFDTLANNYTTRLSFSYNELNEKIAECFSDFKPSEKHSDNIKNIRKTENGAVICLNVGNHTLTGDEFAEILHLRSCCFTVDFKNNVYTFTVYGYGNNIGLSKYGACKLAEQGYDFKEILQYYYSGVNIL